MNALSREVPTDPAHAALLVIDVQNYCVSGKSAKTEYFGQSLRDSVLPNIQCFAIGLPAGRVRGALFGYRKHDARRPRPQPRLQDLRHRRAARLM